MAALSRPLNIAVVGTGVIGASWSTLFLANGHKVFATDPAVGAEKRLHDFVKHHWSLLQQLRYPSDIPFDKLIFKNELKDAVGNADFVQENGPENVDFKVKLLQEIDTYTPEHAIIASSSSGLPSSSFISGCKKPSRILIGHPFNPPHLVPLVEIVPNSFTAEEKIQEANEFYKTVGKTPIILRKEVKGFAANRLQAALIRECYSLVKEEVCSADDVDKAITQGPGLRWALLGPFLDGYLGGGKGGIRHMLEHLGPSMEEWWADFKSVQLDEETRKLIVTSTDVITSKMDMTLAEEDRDNMLVNIVREKKQYKSFC